MRVFSDAALSGLPGNRSVADDFTRLRVGVAAGGVASVAEALDVDGDGATERAASALVASAAFSAADWDLGVFASCGSAFGWASCSSSPQPPLSGVGGGDWASDLGAVVSGGDF